MSKARPFISGMTVGALIFALGAVWGFLAAGVLREGADGKRVAAADSPEVILAALSESTRDLPEGATTRFIIPFRPDGGRGFGPVVPRANFAPLPLVETPGED